MKSFNEFIQEYVTEKAGAIDVIIDKKLTNAVNDLSNTVRSIGISYNLQPEDKKDMLDLLMKKLKEKFPL